MSPLNVVCLHAHDAGRFVQPYGYPVATPHLMTFARESALFRKAFAVSPTCGPSRAALTSGQYPHQLGMYGLPGPQGWLFDDYGKHLVQRFNSWGYLTVLAGVQHEADHRDFSCIGYQRVLENEAPMRPQAGEFYPETLDKIESFLATYDKSHPFFLSIGIDEPHRDNIPRPELNLRGKSDRFSKTRHYDPERLDARYTAPPPWLPDLPEIRKDMESFREGARLMDEYMGRVIYAVEHAGLRESTLIIITSDHGIEFPGGKKTLSDQGTQVMLMIRGPESTPFHGGRVIEPMVSHLDLYPTLCEVLRTTVSHPLAGKSLLPLMNGAVGSLREELFLEQTYHGELEPIRAIRTERYKFALHFHDVWPQLRHDGPSTPVMEKAGWYDRPEGREALYDLYLDPMEACNRAHDPAYAEIKDKLSRRLHAWMTETKDPFATGAFPAPPGRQ